ncbi:MAG: protein translocase subunit SecF, partial [Gemmatimonadota bacterium]|nr:protein translocase subunit SecF [Gemmatimonadota bacterium]
LMRLFDNAKYEFLRVRKQAYLASLLVLIPGILFLAFRGLNESIEFTGGALIQVHALDSAVTIGGIRSALGDQGIRGAELSTFGTARDFLIRAASVDPETESEASAEATARGVSAALSATFGEEAYRIERVEAVGPRVGRELRFKALMAVLLSFGATLIYLTLRFEWRFAVAAIGATAHDILLTIAFVSLMNLEITLVVIAAVLTIVGYSLNDTIIVFDRVRENLHKYKRQSIYEVLNQSVNETLPRTVLTAGTTFAATASLLIFAGQVIRGFAWVMAFGLVVGTFSSIFIASPILLWIERRWPGEDIRGTKTLDSPRVQPAPTRAD